MRVITLPAKRWLAAWLLACPALLAVAVFVLPGFNQLHGTLTERSVLLVLVALPLMGVVGIVRCRPSTLRSRFLLSARYLVPGVVLALFAVIFIGCSLAGACFQVRPDGHSGVGFIQELSCLI